jgi:CRP-like cAMP-binding protein
MSSGSMGKDYAAGEIIVMQGETGDCMFAIQKGRVEILRRGKGGEVRVAVLEEGEVFGEMAIFEREVRSATVRALGEARLLTVDKKTFLRRVQEDPTLAFNLMQQMSRRIRRMNGELVELQLGGVPRVRAPLDPAQAAPPIERRDRKDRRVAAERRTGQNRRKGGRRGNGAAAPATAT